MAERIGRVEEYTQGGREAFMQSPLIQDAVTRNLEIIGEAASKISQQLKDERARVQRRQIVGLRKTLIYDYGRVDMNIIWQIVETQIPLFKRSVEYMLREYDTIVGERDSKI